MSGFFYCDRLSSAQLVLLQAPKYRPIIDPYLVEQTAYRRDINDIGYKSVFTNSWLVHVRQRNRSWIKRLGNNPQNSQKSELIDGRNTCVNAYTIGCGVLATIEQ